MDEVAKAVLVGILTVVIAVINQEDRDRYSKRHKYFLFTFQIFLSKIILR